MEAFINLSHHAQTSLDLTQKSRPTGGFTAVLSVAVLGGALYQAHIPRHIRPAPVQPPTHHLNAHSEDEHPARQEGMGLNVRRLCLGVAHELAACAHARRGVPVSGGNAGGVATWFFAPPVLERLVGASGDECRVRTATERAPCAPQSRGSIVTPGDGVAGTHPALFSGSRARPRLYCGHNVSRS